MKRNEVICLDVSLQHKQQWLDPFLYFIREGDEIRLETLNKVNGRVFSVARMTVEEFDRLHKKLCK
jgi:hypothetical protein